MNTETMITELKAVAEKHKNDKLFTFQTNITAMCGDIIPKLEQLAEYEAIGTVEECREARERQRGKKPNHFYKKYGKHQWKRKDDGEIDEYAWDSETHSGVICEVCGECVCTMCNPDYDELDDCEEEYWICPNCAKKIYCKDEYCQCGQHLDWSDTP